MGKTYNRPNVRAEKIGPNKWLIKFNKTQNGKQWKKKKTFECTEKQVTKVMDEFCERWERQMAMEKGACSLNRKTATISDI